MEANCPFASRIFHLKPFIISLIKSALNLNSVSYTSYGLIVWPAPSKFNFFSHLVKLDVALFIEISRRKLELSKIWMNCDIFTDVVLQILGNDVTLVCTEY